MKLQSEVWSGRLKFEDWSWLFEGKDWGWGIRPGNHPKRLDDWKKNSDKKEMDRVTLLYIFSNTAYFALIQYWISFGFTAF